MNAFTTGNSLLSVAMVYLRTTYLRMRVVNYTANVVTCRPSVTVIFVKSNLIH